MTKRAVNPWQWQDRFGFVQATEVAGARRTLFVAGQASMGPAGESLHPGDMAAQLGQALDNLETVMREAGFQMADVVRLNFYTTDMNAFLAASGLIRERVTNVGARYASTLLGVACLARPELLVEIEATAVR